MPDFFFLQDPFSKSLGYLIAVIVQAEIHSQCSLTSWGNGAEDEEGCCAMSVLAKIREWNDWREYNGDFLQPFKKNEESAVRCVYVQLLIFII